MTIEADYLDVMPLTISWYAKSGALNNYAARSFSGTATTARGYVQFRSEVEGSNGGVEESRDVYPKGDIYLYGNVTISVDDKIMLPDGQEVKVLDVSKVYDETGVHHVKVTF
jgi:hypothetical protein